MGTESLAVIVHELLRAILPRNESRRVAGDTVHEVER